MPFNTSVSKALDEIDKDWDKYEGIIVCGSHETEDAERVIERIKEAREKKEPALLICMGYQLGAIEYARNILGIKDAISEEFGEGTLVVQKRPELKVGLHDGESWWSNYEVVIDWNIPDNWVAVPYHPEYNSSKDRPHRDLLRFINICKNGIADGQQVL